MRNAKNTEIIYIDATEYLMPDMPLVVFMYNPFEPPILEKTIVNVKQSVD